MLKTLIEKWASAGTRTPEYNSAKIAKGWKLGEPPAHYAWNAIEHKRDAIIEALQYQAAGLQTCPPQIGVDDLCAGMVVSQWANPAGAPNVITLGDVVRDSALGFDLVTETPYLWILFASGAVHKVTGAWVYTGSPAMSSAITLAYPTAPDEVYALCADSGSVYVVWGETGGDFQISRFNAVTGAEVWTTDTAIPCSLSGGEDIRIITANTGNLAVLLPGDIFGVSAQQIGILAKATGAAAYGVGSYVEGYGDSFHAQNAKIVSDGTHVFWLQYQSAAPNAAFFLMSAAIADPATSTYASRNLGAVTLADEYTHPRGLAVVPDGVVIATPEGTFNLFVKATEDLLNCFSLANFSAYGDALGGADCSISSDGLNIWVHLVGLYSPSTQDTVFVRIPIKSISSRSEIAGELSFPMLHVSTDSFDEDYTAGKVIFDGRDLWFTKRSGFSFRITNPGAR